MKEWRNSDHPFNEIRLLLKEIILNDSSEVLRYLSMFDDVVEEFTPGYVLHDHEDVGGS